VSLPAARAPARSALIDSLRGAALLGVIVMNALAYPHALGSPLGVVSPADSTIALSLHALASALLQAKSYAFLAFLSGYAWAMQVRGRRGEALARAERGRRARMLRQGALGIAHGLFIWFGDILSWLALLGLLLLQAPRWRLRVLRNRMFAWFAVWLLLAMPLWAARIIDGPPGFTPPGAWAVVDASSWPEVFAIHREGYFAYVVGAPWQLPMMLSLGLLGVWAGRLRVLERARIGARAWRTGTRVLLPLGAAGALLQALLVIRGQRELGGDFSLADLASQLTGPLLAAGLVLAVAGAWHRRGGLPLLARCEALGRLSLSAYVAHTLCCALLMSGAALGWAPGSVGLFAFGLAWWAIAVCVAPLWRRHAGEGPLERWVRGAGWGSRRNTTT
jgi:uncharacterized protein